MKRVFQISSRREGAIWLLTTVVLLGIYSSLGSAPRLSRRLEEMGLSESLFVIGLLLLVIAVVTNGWRTRPSGIDLLVSMGLAGVFLMLLARIAVPAERTHLFEYSFVALLIHQGLKERERNGHHLRRPALLALSATAALGWLDEGLQALLPNRVYDLRDVAFNAMAALFAVGTSELLAWVRLSMAGRSP